MNEKPDCINMKLPYEQVTMVVDKLYEKTFPKGTPEKEYEEYCEFIAQTIESMGWSVEEYTYRYIIGLSNSN